VPVGLEEAAACDGASRLQALGYIVLPLAAPGLTATVILSIIFAWNEYLFAIVFASATASKTLPAAANDFITGYAINWGPVFASGVVIVLPVSLAALLLQRYIVRGLTLGAFK
jgi:multiple sugar transport system permease protein